MHVGYIRVKDNLVTDYNFIPIPSESAQTLRVFGPDGNLDFPDGETLVKKGELITNISIYTTFTKKGTWFYTGPSLVVVTNRRIIILRQPGGGLIREGMYMNTRSLQLIETAQKAINDGLKEFVSIDLTNGHDKFVLSNGLICIGGLFNGMKGDVIFEPREKAEMLFHNYLPDKMRSKKTLTALKNGDFVDSKENIKHHTIEEQIPLAGFKTPMFCPKCGTNTKGESCQKCSVTPQDYTQPIKKIPTLMSAGRLILYLTSIAAIIIAYLALSDGAYSVAGIVGVSAPFWAYYGHRTGEMIKRIKHSGKIKCGYCNSRVSSNSKMCIYCGQRISWFI
jgi:hypothetical protein